MTLVAHRPSQQLVDLVRALGGSWTGYTAMCRCPAHADREPSLSLRQGDRGILVTCFAGCNREDVLRELSRIVPGRSYSAPAGDFSPARHQGAVERLWGTALPVPGTLAERYLKGRRLPSDLPDTRFHPRCPHGPKPLTRFKPALLVALREGGRLTAVQRIFLDRDSAQHTAKVMLGRPGQGAWIGSPPAQALAIAEGFETAAAFGRLHGMPCWAALGARRLDQLLIPASVTTLLIAEDPDPEGRRAARRAWAQYRQPGRTLRRVPPPQGMSDWAEVLALKG